LLLASEIATTITAAACLPKPTPLTLEPTSAKPEPIEPEPSPSPEPTETPEPTEVPKPTPFPETVGGQYPAEVQDWINNSGYNELQSYWEVWAKAGILAQQGVTSEARALPIFSPDNPEGDSIYPAIVVYDSNGQPEKWMFPPIDLDASAEAGKIVFRQLPGSPSDIGDINDKDNPYRPLFITPDAAGQFPLQEGEFRHLEVRDGVITLVNQEGTLIAQINLETGQWEEVEAEVETDREESLIKTEVVHPYEAEVMGVPVKFTIGLHPTLVHDPEYPIKDVVLNNDVLFPHHITGEQVTAKQLLGELVMRSHWKAWQEDDPSRQSTGFEQYMELVKQGEGKYIVSATLDDPSLPIEEKYKFHQVEVDPLKPITIVLSGRADPMVSFVEDAGFWIAQRPNGEIVIEMTFKGTIREKYYNDSSTLRFYTGNTFRSGLETLSFPREIQESKEREIGGRVSADENLTDFLVQPELEISQLVFKAITN